jgi:hypothetical protein
MDFAGSVICNIYQGCVCVFSCILLQFLQEVASHSDTNKMDVTNLALIVAPSVMPVEEKIVVYGTSRLSHHVQVVEVCTQMSS